MECGGWEECVPWFTTWAIEWIAVLRQRTGEREQDNGGGYEDDDSV